MKSDLMRDRLLTYAIGGSIAVHLVLLGVVGTTSAAKPIEIERLKVVSVDLAPDPGKVSVDADRPKPEQDAAKPRAASPPPDVPYVPPVRAMVNRDEARRLPPNVKPVGLPSPVRVATAANTDPGNPGGALSGITSPNGQDLGTAPTGNTGAGYVPGSDNGTGSGSGTGPGQGPPDPVVNPPTGNGNDPTPVTPVHVDPPAPKMISVTVCAASGLIPNQHCAKKDTRSFREGTEPRATCTDCKAPFVPTIADRREPELEKDSQPKIPSIDEPGEYMVKIRYTVNKEGGVEDVEVVDSSGIQGIDRAVCTAAAKMRYKPAVQNGEPRSVKITRRYRIEV